MTMSPRYTQSIPWARLSLLDALERAAPQLSKVVLASTSQVYGNSNDDPMTERTPTAPVSHYACSKLSMELMARTRFDRLPIVITRPFNYIGRGQAHQFLLPKLMDHFRRRAPIVQLGNMDVERDFLDVRSVADVYVRLLESPCARRAQHSVRRRAQSAQHHRGFDLHYRASHPTEVNSTLVRNNEVARLVGSSERLQQAVGTLCHTEFEETLRWMLESPT